MSNDFYIARKESFDLSNLQKSEKLSIVSFNIKVLDKFSSNPDYSINLNNDVGVLSSQTEGWSLQIDVNYDCGYLSTWLYKLSNLPDIQKKHFETHNIYARELSPTAYSRWVEGKP
ncbi:Uncharacterised protein [Legionella wadsworthii]|uniref:Uncharacterized protein n=1 Tax=Legionella wadsworthii TaxID=28088 RepID=A0A378LVS4_9GAMM|nr:hypothetical protein [Legionella wadsworthii]STY31711.1 Uncharacterised protein [Legionella wadsworthii]